jgi:putative Holliday junction resolvase
VNTEEERLSPISDVIPQSGRVIGIDFGTARIGVAITDPGQSIASPLEIRQVQNQESDAKYFQKLVQTEQPAGFIVGLPLHMSGDQSKKSREAVAFGQWLREVTDLPVAWHDERYSTAMAKEVCQQLGLSGTKRKAHLDKIAAQVILSSWLERKDRTGDEAESLED